MSTNTFHDSGLSFARRALAANCYIVAPLRLHDGLRLPAVDGLEVAVMQLARELELSCTQSAQLDFELYLIGGIAIEREDGHRAARRVVEDTRQDERQRRDALLVEYVPVSTVRPQHIATRMPRQPGRTDGRSSDATPRRPSRS